MADDHGGLSQIRVREPPSVSFGPFGGLAVGNELSVQEHVAENDAFIDYMLGRAMAGYGFDLERNADIVKNDEAL